MLLGGFDMMRIDEILKISNEMGIKIIDNINDKHYILNEFGEEIEFSVDMLMESDETSTSSKIDLQLAEDYGGIKFSSQYKLADCENLYVSKPVSINESIINAA